MAGAVTLSQEKDLQTRIEAKHKGSKSASGPSARTDLDVINSARNAKTISYHPSPDSMVPQQP
jgi:hypothetical protein